MMTVFVGRIHYLKMGILFWIVLLVVWIDPAHGIRDTACVKSGAGGVGMTNSSGRIYLGMDASSVGPTPECVWKLRPAEGEGVYLTYEYFNLGPKIAPCGQANITIVDWTHKTALRHCSSENDAIVGQPIYVPSTNIDVIFRVSHEMLKYGFILHYQAVTCPALEIPSGAGIELEANMVTVSCRMGSSFVYQCVSSTWMPTPNLPICPDERDVVPVLPLVAIAGAAIVFLIAVIIVAICLTKRWSHRGSRTAVNSTSAVLTRYDKGGYPSEDVLATNKRNSQLARENSQKSKDLGGPLSNKHITWCLGEDDYDDDDRSPGGTFTSYRDEDSVSLDTVIIDPKTGKRENKYVDIDIARTYKEMWRKVPAPPVQARSPGGYETAEDLEDDYIQFNPVYQPQRSKSCKPVPHPRAPAKGYGIVILATGTKPDSDQMSRSQHSCEHLDDLSNAPANPALRGAANNLPPHAPVTKSADDLRDDENEKSTKYGTIRAIKKARGPLSRVNDVYLNCSQGSGFSEVQPVDADMECDLLKERHDQLRQLNATVPPPPQQPLTPSPGGPPRDKYMRPNTPELFQRAPPLPSRPIAKATPRMSKRKDQAKNNKKSAPPPIYSKPTPKNPKKDQEKEPIYGEHKNVPVVTNASRQSEIFDPRHPERPLSPPAVHGADRKPIVTTVVPFRRRPSANQMDGNSGPYPDAYDYSQGETPRRATLPCRASPSAAYRQMEQDSTQLKKRFVQPPEPAAQGSDSDLSSGDSYDEVYIESPVQEHLPISQWDAVKPSTSSPNNPSTSSPNNKACGNQINKASGAKQNGFIPNTRPRPPPKPPRRRLPVTELCRRQFVIDEPTALYLGIHEFPICKSCPDITQTKIYL